MKKNVAVLMGGKSSEHEISLMSGREVTKHLDPKKYNVLPIVVSKDGTTWQLKDKEEFLLESSNKKNKKTKDKSRSLTTSDHTKMIKNQNIDVVFIAMHGKNGEDGTVQGFLELAGVPYTGSGVLASALGMDKVFSRDLFIRAGLTVPKGVIVTKKDPISKIIKNIKLPVFVKPSDQGSSVGTSKVRTINELKKALKTAFKYSQKVIVDEYIDGIELTCAILGNENPKALPLVEIVTKKDFFDYEAKYSETLTEEIVPARISKSLTKKAQEAALIAYKTLGCKGFGRVDLITKGQKIYVLEVNTIPGLTSVSLLPKAAKAEGISYSNLLERIINFVG